MIRLLIYPLLVLLGGGIGFVMTHQRLVSDLAPYPPEPALLESLPRLIATPVSPEPSKSSQRAPVDWAERYDPVDPTWVEQLIAEAEPEPLPPASGVIRGRVLDWHGQPIPGVRVRATPSIAGGFDQGDPRGLVNEVVRKEQLRKRRVETVTGADGRFRFEGVLDMKHTVRAEREGWGFEESRNYRGESSGEDVAIYGARLVRVPIEIRSADGSPVDEATIRVQRLMPIGARRRISRGRRETWRSVSGSIELLDTAVVALGAESDGRRTRQIAVDLSAEPLVPVVLTLEAPTELRIEFTPSPGEGLGQLTVKTTAAHPLAPSGAEEWMADRVTTVGRMSPHDDRAVQAVSPGLHRIDVARFGRPVGSWWVDVPPGVHEVRVPLPPVETGHGVFVEIVDGDGAPIESPRFGLKKKLRVRGRSGSSSGGVDSLQITPGRFYLAGEEIDEALDWLGQGGSATLTISKRGYHSSSASVPDVKGGSVRVVLERDPSQAVSPRRRSGQ